MGYLFGYRSLEDCGPVMKKFVKFVYDRTDGKRAPSAAEGMVLIDDDTDTDGGFYDRAMEHINKIDPALMEKDREFDFPGMIPSGRPDLKHTL